MVFPTLIWILFIVSLVLSVEGFYRFVWFMTVGYGIAVSGCGIAIIIYSFINSSLSASLFIICLLMIIYGFRLGLFLLLRELKNAAYKKVLDSQVKKVPVFVSVCMWVACSALYPLQVSPVMYSATNGTLKPSGSVWEWIGIAVAAIGIIVEAISDKQKSEAKKKNPGMPAMDGLFKFSRCPNYFGECVFWTGLVIYGIGSVTGWQWLVVAIGYVAIVYIMFSGVQRLERRHIKNYGDKDEYIKYADSTPVFIPFIPIYHVVKEAKKK